jgi:hypothetical protein
MEGKSIAIVDSMHVSTSVWNIKEGASSHLAPLSTSTQPRRSCSTSRHGHEEEHRCTGLDLSVNEEQQYAYALNKYL